MTPYSVTTPIYYVNDAPHIGHCYTTLLADVLARFHRLAGRDVFFLTGTDEHADKVVTSAEARGLTPIEWADKNADAFRDAFALMGFSNDDFIRTTEDRHKDKVTAYIAELQERGDVELGEYKGWWDPSQEEYVTENEAREHGYKSPVTGKELIERTEHNYFFRLSAYADRLRAHIEANPGFILPESRRNEVMGRIKQGLRDVPISRAIDESDSTSQWGIRMPGDEGHRVYVWIDALFNYLSVVDTDDRSKYWPAQAHLIAKDILWFHAVIWPCMLMALGRPLPGCVYAHSYWIREGRKMSKSLGNFLDLPTLRAYGEQFSLDALRYYLLVQGPLGSTDADFAHEKFVETYNADLANGIGNAFSRVTNMIGKYFDGKMPEMGTHTYEGFDWAASAQKAVGDASTAAESCDIAAMAKAGIGLSNMVDAFINVTEPFKLAKDETKTDELATILAMCAEALRLAGVLLLPSMPTKMAELLSRLGQTPPDLAHGTHDFASITRWGSIAPGTSITKGEALFMRADADAPPPEAAEEIAGGTA
ncbi:MAG: methionine--tRNA ligase [Phycisphaerales bacterium]